MFGGTSTAAGPTTATVSAPDPFSVPEPSSACDLADSLAGGSSAFKRPLDRSSSREGFLQNRATSTATTASNVISSTADGIQAWMRGARGFRERSPGPLKRYGKPSVHIRKGVSDRSGADTTSEPPSTPAPESESDNYTDNYRDYLTFLSSQRGGRRRDQVGASIEEVPGDLFDEPPNVPLAHCVSALFEMSGGIARRFSDKFGNRRHLLDQRLRVGEVAELADVLALLPEDDEELVIRAKIYYLVTKANKYAKPRPEDLLDALLALKEKMLMAGEQVLAIPRLGTGQGQGKSPLATD